MQDPTTFQPFKPQLPEQEQLKCPRCDSSNTKFCYYNNYNLSQPRHFCKSCRRYWTKGGALRNIPIGGGTRKNSKKASSTFKRPSSSSSSSSSISSLPKAETILPIFTQPMDSDRHMLDITGSFSSLLSSNGRFGNLLGGFNSPNSIQFGDFTEHSNSSSVENPALELLGTNNGDGFLGLQGGGGGDSNCWDGANGWPDLAIHTPGSGFH